MRTLLVDNYDSYTYNLFQLMSSTFGAEPTVVTNDSNTWDGIDLSLFDAVVVSPGPGHPARDSGRSLSVLASSDVPVLGVCLGHQLLGLLGGASVVPAPQPRHGHLERVWHNETGLFEGIPSGFTAVRYHSLCVSPDLPSSLEALAFAEDGVVMALRHRERPWWGVQFHPESVASQHGDRLMRNFGELARAHRRWRVITSRVDGTVDCGSAFASVFGPSADAFWLDSCGRARFSFLGDSGGPHGEVLRGPDVLELLERRLRERRVSADLPFDLPSGYVGYFSYEFGSGSGRVPDEPVAQWMAATRLIVVDHEERQTWVVALTDGSAEAEARAWVTATRDRLEVLAPLGTPVGRPADPEPWLDRPRERYLADIEECQRQLRLGESYEICLTNRASLPFHGDPFELYLRMRAANPAPYAAFLRFGSLHVLCTSPERFLKISDAGDVESKPIKGTAPRDDDPVRDSVIATSLALDPKTRAENLMIVDLLRNDLGRVCEVGSVHVPSFMAVESFATVHQLVSTVRGRLRSSLSAVDAVRACFPGGSMTGAPKRRTMEIIDRLEQRPRGIYSGALGFFGLTGAADLNIVIRTAVVRDGVLTVGAGGAIVLDSDAEAEFEEMLIKARAPLRALMATSVSDLLPGPVRAVWGHGPPVMLAAKGE
ncbi:aminodeoxychorismate synthase, component I [Lentzea sp. NBRC 105346]|uniref:aminodeoxychorismate synthase component I n=1 Tax=Lentzea sp. NBRC 105346 TaxID=3032205 RepID=UPI0024A15DE4|nr:aminodeoxychorismate synthase component I [Lentzea sp. NBRC 105346]GLZ36366.1 aminodeoxychorismate synthase, component I [Lentzea sp. NBRC 105346]